MDIDTKDPSAREPKAPKPAQLTQRRVNLNESEQKTFVRVTDPLFDKVMYWINPVISEEKRESLVRALERGGAVAAIARLHRPKHSANCRYDKLNGVIVNGLPQMASHISRFHLAWPKHRQEARRTDTEIRRATHVITPDTHFGEYAACLKAGVRVVTPQWVEQSVLSGWQYRERFFSASEKMLFSGMVVMVTQMPSADKKALLTSIVALGGQWRDRLRPDVTHLVLVQAEGDKYGYAQNNPQLNIVSVLPHWFQESLSVLYRVPITPYVFPNPPVLRGEMGIKDEPAGTSALAMPVGAENSGSGGGGAYELPKPRSAFMAGCVVAIGTQLRHSLSEGAVARLTQRLTEAGACVCEPRAAQSLQQDHGTQALLEESLISDWEDVDVLVCQHREGYEYSKAARLGKVIGTLVWLYQVFLTETLTAPTRRLLHYPLPPTAVPGMERLVVSVSNYTGAARDYIRMLVVAMGGRYTGQLTRANTTLVTACAQGAKYEAATRSSTIDVVNHLWVEQCCRRWKMLSTSHPSFVHLPMLPLLNGTVGEAGVDVSRLRSWVDVPQGNALAEWSDMDVLSDSDLNADGIDTMAVRTGTGNIYDMHAQLGADGAATAADGISGGGAATEGEDEDGDDDDDEVRSVAESSTGDQTDVKDEQQTAARHTSRAAAMAATKSLGEMMRAANIFECEMRKERLYKYRRAANGSGRTAAVPGEDPEADAEPQQQQQQLNSGVKRRRVDGSMGKVGGAPVRIMLTQVRLSANEQLQIAALGGSIVDSASDATHLIGTKIKRTFKMLMALASGRICIVQRSWLDDSLARGAWIPINDSPGDEDDEEEGAAASQYLLTDPETELRWGFELKESMRRARCRRLLAGVTVLVTPSTDPGLETLRALVEIAGGRAVSELPDRRLRAMLASNESVLRKARAQGGELADLVVPPLLVVSCKEDSGMWPRFQPAASAGGGSGGGSHAMVFNVELLLTGLLRQKIEVHSEEFLLIE
ncbi:regulator of Ty1 Transposition [Kickxella alabastrina]|uniref:Regulator of Ty1 Transposition n=1 Tax=Kickxella alabastrina TaxID=61397 RepID=A0ACC1IBU5_9FUNG|nr:regulator of Ty1 Transposition [Kickxella alabastrina]